MDEEKLTKLIKTYNNPENLPYMLTPKCNEELGGGNIVSTNRRSDDTVLLKIHMHTDKAACAVADACDNIVNLNVKPIQRRKIIAHVINVLAFLGVVTAEISQFKMEQTKNRLPAKIQLLTKNVTPEFECLFGNDLSKRISELSSTITALIKTIVSSYT